MCASPGGCDAADAVFLIGCGFASTAAECFVLVLMRSVGIIGAGGVGPLHLFGMRCWRLPQEQGSAKPSVDGQLRWLGRNQVLQNRQVAFQSTNCTPVGLTLIRSVLSEPPPGLGAKGRLTSLQRDIECVKQAPSIAGKCAAKRQVIRGVVGAEDAMCQAV